MNFAISLIFILAICVIDAKDKITDKVEELVVNEKNQEKFGLPVGTVLQLDKPTDRYKPPPLSANFTADDRLKLMWDNKKTQKNYCKVGPGKLASFRLTYNYFRHQWCRNNDGENVCCDNKKCVCNEEIWVLSYDCECLSDEEAKND